MKLRISQFNTIGEFHCIITNFLFQKNVFKKMKSPVVEFIYHLTLIDKPYM